MVLLNLNHLHKSCKSKYNHIGLGLQHMDLVHNSGASQDTPNFNRDPAPCLRALCYVAELFWGLALCGQVPEPLGE